MPIDGLKISVIPIGISWETLPQLEFATPVNETTGEVLNSTRVAKYKGLLFSIHTSRKNPSLKTYSIRGSISNYFNSTPNNDDFEFKHLKQALNSLSSEFGVDLTTSIIHNIEFGVNIQLPITAKKVLNHLIASKNQTFGTLKIQGVDVGKSIYKQRYRLKIYDKGKRLKLDNKHLLRVEVAIKKMDYLKQYNIKYLSDLLEVKNIFPLGKIILNEWNNIIYYDGSMTGLKQMTPFEQKKFLYYLRPVVWIKFEKKQRMRARNHFLQLLNKHSSINTQQDIAKLISLKWNKLAASFCPPLNKVQGENNSLDLSTFEQLEYTGQKGTYPNLNKSKKKSKKRHRKKRVCIACNSDISHKKKAAIYCSKSCNNYINGLRRTKKNIEIRKKEKANILKLKKILHLDKLIIAITYTHNKEAFTDILFQNEINANPNWIRKVNKLRIDGIRKNAKPIELTGVRSRKLIKIITKINIKKDEKRIN